MEGVSMKAKEIDAEKSVSRVRLFIYFAAGMAGLLFGLDQGVISGALPFISKEWNLSSSAQEWVVSSMMVGAATGAIVASFLAKKIGRKKSLMIGAALFIIGSLGSGTAANADMLISFRLVLGLSVGIASYTAPLYLAEMADKDARGKVISGYQLMVTVGILVAFLSDTALSYSGNWRMMLMVIAIPAVILILTVVKLPDSPRWLAAVGRMDEASAVLHSLNASKEAAEEELTDIKETLKIKQAGWSLFRSNKNVRRAVFLGVLLQAMQQFTGFNVIMYYSPKILSLAGFSSTEDQMIGTVINGIVFTLSTFIAIWMVDKSGRKPALKVGFGVMAISMAVVGSLHVDAGKRQRRWLGFLCSGDHDDGQYCRVRYERWTDCLGALLGDSAAQEPGIRYCLLDHDELDYLRHRRCNLPDAGRYPGLCSHVLALCADERILHHSDHGLCAGNQECIVGED
jgi:SP family arabinose:H+ symporter-like MFS transporter